MANLLEPAVESKVRDESSQKGMLPSKETLKQVTHEIAAEVKVKKCTCQRGKCLQKYCVCLKAGKGCDPAVCLCVECQNDERQTAVERRAE